ncbi:hypothetical protein PHYSODRAFT_259475 [Phytophthora sojae]|uniref:Uncharacterized protein n=1 Tax=Phytophthora sojae (strain P6497) TaxID=1094619 RepID=G4ZAX4_PHYSP|nr:hypothetical protein PHYSODRAFT_259475 [Phytophthora sojae]EGZ20602.1 hypothetical protein PHYSODRAFT_259475 [Phytophthora sojae]|eukprot:XP_009523319.1 hypothetical protein PHYSODRAFT_259475 [Phytophthora sojae]
MVVPTSMLAAAVGKRKRGTGPSRNQKLQAKRCRERNQAAAKKRKTSSGAVTTKRTPKTSPRKRKTPVKPKPTWTRTTVKMKLRPFCKDEGLALAWDSVLRDMNKMVAETYMLAAVHMVRCCEQGSDIPILARSFYQQCLSAVSGGNLHHPLATMTEEFRDSVAIYSAWRGESPIPNRDAINRGWAQVAAKRMAHETQNHLQLNFYRRFKQYITLRYGLAGRDRYLVLKGILDPEYDGDNEIVLEYRELIPRNDEGYLDQRASELLPLVHMFLTFVEDHNREHEGEPARGGSSSTGRDPTRTIVGFGDWSCSDFGGVIKKSPGGPSERFMRELSNCRVEMESEYRTSKVHHGCRQAHPGDLVNQYQRQECRDGVVRNRKIHSVLHCLRNNGGCGITVNSDLNASRNILRAFELRLSGQPRPPELTMLARYSLRLPKAAARCISSPTPALVLQQTPATSGGSAKTSVPPVSQGEKAWCDIYGIQEALHESPVAAQGSAKQVNYSTSSVNPRRARPILNVAP